MVTVGVQVTGDDEIGSVGEIPDGEELQGSEVCNHCVLMQLEDGGQAPMLLALQGHDSSMYATCEVHPQGFVTVVTEVQSIILGMHVGQRYAVAVTVGQELGRALLLSLLLLVLLPLAEGL